MLFWVLFGYFLQNKSDGGKVAATGAAEQARQTWQLPDLLKYYLTNKIMFTVKLDEAWCGSAKNIRSGGC